jgi:hypothetical protein
VVIKGATQEDAVLCTSDKTFALKAVETTNTLLLLPPQEVRAVCRNFAVHRGSCPCSLFVFSLTPPLCLLLQELDEDFAAIPSLPTPGAQLSVAHVHHRQQQQRQQLSIGPLRQHRLTT